MPKQEPITYEAAMQRLEDIVRKIENNEISIDHLAEQLKEAQAIIKQCKKRLLAIDKDINDLLTDEKTAAQ